MREIYGYARVSSQDQSLERQLIQLREVVTDERHIITDKQSGKNFDRKGYNQLVGTEQSAPTLRQGDLLVITSLDRLGRNYTEIREQWLKITHEIGADIQVLEMPLLNTATEINTKDNLDRRFIADLVLQILSYTAEKEHKAIRERQQQGYDAMPIIDGKRVSLKTGRPAGRPEAEYPADWEMIYTQWQNGLITATTAMGLLGLKRTTFYKLAKAYKNKK